MIYKISDINFAQISPTQFEALCYQLLLKYGFFELSWRQGGADNGRDIEGALYFSSQLYTKKTKWFFECKRYTTGGVPPEELNSKIAWADAEEPDFLLIFVSSYITVPARTWLERIKANKLYDIVVIEGEDLKNRIIQFPDLVEIFFAANPSEQLLLDIKKHWLAYHIKPSYQSLNEIAANISADKLTLSEIVFLLNSFYREYRYFKDGDHRQAGNFNSEILKPLYDQLKRLASTEQLELFNEYKDDFDYLGGDGIFDSVDYEIEDIEEDEIEHDELFQYYDLHLNYRKSNEHWKIGYYLFFVSIDGFACEIFILDNSDFTTCAKIYPKYTKEILQQLAIHPSDDILDKVLLFYPTLNT